MSMTQLDACERETELRLQRWGFERVVVDPMLAQAEGQEGRFQLRASCWRREGAEARVVRIRGGATGIYNCLIFPERPEAVPVFVAELLVTGGGLRVAFIDLQVPGLGEVCRGSVVEKAKALARRYGHRNTREPAPNWAVEYSAAEAAYIRPSNPEEENVTELYLEYLDTWADSSAGEGSGDPAGARVALGRFKRHHREEAPVGNYLGRVFGTSWAARFLDTFLYQ